LDSLLADGYELKTVTDITPDEQKVIWPNDQTSPYLMITLQKGASLAVCTAATANLINLNPTTTANAALCHKK
jgi:hypothetical protein